MPQIGDVDELKDASFMALSSPPSASEAHLSPRHLYIPKQLASRLMAAYCDYFMYL